jgi:hypothetical protein
MNSNLQNTEYEILSVQPWEIEGAEELSDGPFEANTQHDQQADQSYEYSS